VIGNFINRLGTPRADLRAHRYPKDQGYVYQAAAFRDILRRECARSDRNGHAFSLAVLHLPAGSSEKVAEAEAIVELVGDRLRVTDQAGWLEPDRFLAVLLYACNADDARTFVERVRRDGPFPHLEYDVYDYPDQFPAELTEGPYRGIPCQK